MEYIILLLSLAGIVVGADLLVAGAVSIARKFKVSDFVIGAAIVGVGTSMPELVVSFIGAVKGNADVAIGNVVGSNIANILLILGVSATINPLTLGGITPLDIFIILLSSVLLLLTAFTFRRRYLDRWEGAIFLLIYGLYIWQLVTR